MRVGIIGAGSMGWQHAAGWANTDASLVGVVSAQRDHAAELAGRYGATVYDSLTQMLPDVDVVDICVPTDLHREFTAQAAAAHKHVMCEKPIARTIADGQDMIAVCQRQGVRLFIAQVVRFFPQYRQVHDAIADGKIGKPAVIRLTRVGWKPQKTDDNWFVDFPRSGGVLLDMLVHDYDYARWLAGDVERVYARCSPGDDPSVPIGDYAQVLLRLRSGAIAHVEGGWANPPGLFRTKIEVAGDGGLIEWTSDSTTPFVAHLKAGPGEASEVGLPLSPLAEDPYTAEIRHFYDAVVNDKPFSVSPADALLGVQIGLAAIESARSGQAITLSLLPEVA
jgi:predicted dehydrogenase